MDRNRQTVLPNVVLVLADDMGYGDVGAFNPDSKIPTPHMDRLATQGMRFVDAHSPSAVCTPSRYGVLTGRYCWRTDLKAGVFAGYEPPLIEPERPTIASQLSEAGYRTGAFGKWHVGLGYTRKDGSRVPRASFPWGAPAEEVEHTIDFTAPVEGGPVALGFDEFFGTSGCPTCQTPYGWIEGDRFVEPPDVYERSHPYTGRPGMRSQSWSHVDVDPMIIDRAVTFIEENAESPFFAYVSLSAPHEPCIDELVPPFARGMSAAGPRGDLVWLVDHAVGRIADTLVQCGVSNDTIFIVTSDNGALPGDRILNAEGDDVYRTYGHNANGDWRGHKAHIWEGGHREPLIVSWPDQISPGSVSSDLVSLTDLFATIAGLIAVDIPVDAAEDSVDQSGVLLQSAQGGRSSIIHHSQRGVFAVRRGNWKAIFGTLGSGGWPPPAGTAPGPETIGQLYDLEADPGEENNLWDEFPTIVTDLHDLLDEARNSNRTAPRRT